MKKWIYALLCLNAFGLATFPASAQQSGNLRVTFQGPGGHSSFDYGRTSALHAAGRSLMLVQQSLRRGSYTVSGFKGGNSVNSIASESSYEVALRAADAAEYIALVAQLTSAVKAGADAENAFRGVKEGDLTAGAPATVRYTVTQK